MLKLTCRFIAACLPKHLITLAIEGCIFQGDNLARGTVRSRYIEYQKRYEFARRRSLKTLLCTDCGRIRPLNAFADAHRRQIGAGFIDRSCMDCIIYDASFGHHFLKAESLLVNGEKFFACEICRTMKPLPDRQYRGRLREYNLPWNSYCSTQLSKTLSSLCKKCAETMTTKQLSYMEAKCQLGPSEKSFKWAPYFAFLRRGRYHWHSLNEGRNRCQNCAHCTYDLFDPDNSSLEWISKCRSDRCLGPRVAL